MVLALSRWVERDFEGPFLAVTEHDDPDAVAAGVLAQGAVEVLEVADLAVAKADNGVSAFEAGAAGRAGLCHAAEPVSGTLVSEIRNAAEVGAVAGAASLWPGDCHVLGAVFSLGQNYPNPFNPSTTILFGLPEPTTVTLRIYDIAGRRVRDLLLEEGFAAGHHEVIWDGRCEAGPAVSSGVYFYALRADRYRETRKMIVLK